MLFNKGMKIADNENVWWLGDFNYRIDMVNEDIRDRIAAGQSHSLFGMDQLKIQMSRNAAF